MTAVRYDLEPQVGGLLRDWRERRRLSQLELANQTGVSARHLSFLETGRSKPSRDMVLRLADQLDVPLRERNPLLLAAGFAPAYAETPMSEPPMSAVRAALRQVLTGHEPYPALVVDGNWNIIDANASFALFTEGVEEDLLVPPVNALRLSLHPKGMAPRINNIGVWRAHLLRRLRRRTDRYMRELYLELRAYPCDQPEPAFDMPGHGDISVPLHLRHGTEELSFYGVLAHFGTPRDITVAELTIESFFPANPATATALATHRRLAPASTVDPWASAEPVTPGFRS
jgi:transcriptional regulator with XRE-family HTH domain